MNLECSTVKRSETIAALSEALAAAQGEMKNPPKDSINPHFKSRYADLATVRDTVLPVLSRHGLSVLQLPCEVEGGPALTSILLHKSGEWVSSTLALRAQQQTPQGIGSALTYCRRYALQSIAGVAADDDDDGNAGGRQQAPRQHQASRPAPVAEQRTAAPVQKAEPQPVADNKFNVLKISGTPSEADAKAEPSRPRVGKAGDPMTDATVVTALAARKGFDWAAIIGQINAQFNATYSMTRTRWQDVSSGHRAATLTALEGMPDKDSVDDLTRLVARVAKAEKTDADTVFARYCAAAKVHESVIRPEHLDGAALARACKAFRAKLDNLADIAGDDNGE